tara:strand:+ start:2813 stop:3004 length:192 start_codon:yes stop_codon:yes gene_type:complete
MMPRNITHDENWNIVLNPQISAINPYKRVIRLTPILKEQFKAPNNLPLKDFDFPDNVIEDKKG